MTPVERDLLARLTMTDQLLAFLLAKQFRSLPVDESRALKATFFGHEHSLGAGLMGADDLQKVDVLIEAHLERVIGWAADIEGHWRRGEAAADA